VRGLPAAGAGDGLVHVVVRDTHPPARRGKIQSVSRPPRCRRRNLSFYTFHPGILPFLCRGRGFRRSFTKKINRSLDRFCASFVPGEWEVRIRPPLW
jgi:hypothetical protein